MDIVLEKKDTTNGTIKVNLKETDYLGKVTEKLKEYSKKANIKGFRPGKVPTSLIQKMYGKSIMVDEINHLLSSSLNNYIKENKLPIIGDPLPDTENAAKIDWETQKEFEFNYKIGLVAEFKCDVSDKVKIPKYQIQIDDKAVKETLENLRSQYGKMSNPEVTEEGDSIYGELKEVNGDFTTNTLVPSNKIKKSEQKKFAGKAKGDKIEFDIEKTFEDTAVVAHVTGLGLEEAKAKKGKFELTVTNINRTELAALDQDFFDKIFGKDKITTEEEFNEKLKDTIKENYDRESENMLSREIHDHYVKNTKIELPNEFLKKWLFITNEGKVTEEQIEKEYDQYVGEVKWSLIKNKIADENNIKVENEDILGKTKEMISQQFGSIAITEELQDSFDKIADNYLKQDNGKNYMKMFEQVFFDKVLNLIKEKVSFQDKKITVEEFKEIANKSR
ncbi:MAG TPA: trigger factor [Cytophagaceae bacterium]|nr:trigger factor [Cytophagaceae bacterium]